MLFIYKAKDQEGRTVEGTVEALNEESALKVLTGRNLVILSFKEATKKTGLGKNIEIPFLNRVKPQDIMIFSRQLSVMISAGLSLVKALEVLIEQTSSKKLKDIIAKIADDVRGGTRFSSSLAKYPRIFDDFYINMVRAGETSGRLEDSLIYLADQQEKNYDLVSKIKGAMTYPIFVLVAIGGILILMLKFVLPRIMGMFEESKAELPLTTKILLDISKFVEHWWILIIIILIIIIALLYFSRTTKLGKRIWDRIILKLPVFGDLFKNIYLARFSRGLSTLIVGGIPLASAIKIVSKLVNNTVYQDLLSKTIIDVKEGRPISTSLLKSSAVPKMLSHILTVGEETGKLDEVLNKMADFYAREVENTLSRLVTLLEPIIILILGGAVAFTASAVLMPMYKMASGI